MLSIKVPLVLVRTSFSSSDQFCARRLDIVKYCSRRQDINNKTKLTGRCSTFTFNKRAACAHKKPYSS